MGELSSLSVPEETRERPVLQLFQGLFYFFHRDKPEQYRLRTPTVSAIVRGTELNVKIDADGTTTLSLLEGSAEVSADFGQAKLDGKEVVVVAPGKAPVKATVLNAANVIQWCLYYPGVLWLGDLEMDVSERVALKDSLAAYEAGDLKAALARYPALRRLATAGERLYLAALLLSVGEVEQAETLLAVC